MGASGVLVGGEPLALLAASSAVYDVASRTDDVGRRLLGALGPAASTVAVAAVFAPLRAGDVARALAEVAISPGAGLASVAAAYHAVSLQLRATGQALEAAGAIGLVASGGLGLLRGERPVVLASADGVDLSRQAVTGGWSLGPVGGSSALAVREVRRPDGTSLFVVEVTSGAKGAISAGIQVNGVGGFAEAGLVSEVTVRWAVATEREAQLVVAMLATGLAGAFRGSHMPDPTEVVTGATASAGLVGSFGPVPGVTSASGAVAARAEVTTLASGAQRFSTSVSGSGQLGLLGLAGTGAAGSAKVTVERNPAGAVTAVSVSTAHEVDRGRHGLPVLEAGNREATLVERTWQVRLTPDQRGAADRVATAVARGQAPDPADIAALAGATDNTEAEAEEHTYDVRHQQASVDVSAGGIGVGGGAAIDTAVLRRP